jgi:O-antigen biosynthesis protein
MISSSNGLWYAAALLAGKLSRVTARLSTRTEPEPDGPPLPPGISVIIPCRNGRDLLEAQLPGICEDLGNRGEILVIDNGSEDGTEQWLRTEWPLVRVDVSQQPLSFAAAINRGLGLARYRRVCLLNDDMLLAPGFFQALEAPFERMPYLFCATAQIIFPEGVRREETGKAVMRQERPEDFPIRCDVPLPGEDGTWVLYGSGGCSLYDAARLRSLGGLDEEYSPAYVEDLDIGYRAWQRGWPTVFAAGAVVEHRHRATTSRYFTPAELDRILEINYLKFLARSVADPLIFDRLWKQAIGRLRLRAESDPAARVALRQAALIALTGNGGASHPENYAAREKGFLAFTNGSVAVYPGDGTGAKPRLLVLCDSPETADATPEDAVLIIAGCMAPPQAAASHPEVVCVGKNDDMSATLHGVAEETRRKWGLRSRHYLPNAPS